jgi:hypothetical protein
MRRVRETEASDMIQFQVRRAGGYLDSLHLRKTKKKSLCFSLVGCAFLTACLVLFYMYYLCIVIEVVSFF